MNLQGKRRKFSFILTQLFLSHSKPGDWNLIIGVQTVAVYFFHMICKIIKKEKNQQCSPPRWFAHPVRGGANSLAGWGGGSHFISTYLSSEVGEIRGVVGVRPKNVSTVSSSSGVGVRRVGLEGARVFARRGRSFTRWCSRCAVGGSSLTESSDSVPHNIS